MLGTDHASIHCRPKREGLRQEGQMNGHAAAEEIVAARKRWRLILFAAIAVALATYAANNVLLILVVHFAVAGIAGQYAACLGYSALGAFLAALFLPVLVPLGIAIFLSPQGRSGQYPKAVVLAQLTRSAGLFSGTVDVSGENAILKPFPGFFGGTAFALADQRLMFAIIPGHFKWRVTSSSQSMTFLSLDQLGDEAFAEIIGMLTEAVMRKKAAGLQLVMADYAGRAALIDLSRLGRNPALLEAIARTRPGRLEKLRQWLADEARVIMKGISLTAAGIERRKSVLPWDEIETFQTMTQNGMMTSLNVVLKKTKPGLFTGKERNLTENLLPAFSPSRKEWYSAECFFWTQMKERP